MRNVNGRRRLSSGRREHFASTGTAIGRGDFLRHSLGAGALALFGCGGALADITSSTPGADTGAGGACSRICEETAGPSPGDGSNGTNVLDQMGAVRQDIRSSFAGLSALRRATVTGNTASGLVAPLTVAV